MSSKRKKKCIEATLATGLGTATGFGCSKLAGATAVGLLLKGAGTGAAAGPVGAALGAIGGLACYGVYKVFRDDD